MHDRELRCATCDGEMVFEVPPGADGHEFPELVCTGCGVAEVLFPATLRYWSRGPGAARGNRIAPQQRRAA